MKFNTKLAITFIGILILPILLAEIAYIAIGFGLFYSVKDNQDDDNKFNFQIMSDPVQAYKAVTADYYDTLVEMAQNEPEKLYDKAFLDEIDEQLKEVSSYLIVRKGDRLYYCSSPETGERIFDRLPQYGDGMRDAATGYYYSDLQYLVKKVDFVFADQSQGSIFLVTHVNMMLSESLLKSLFFALLLVLLATSILLTAWIRKSVFLPLGELNDAMQKIADGNLRDAIKTEEKGEIGELYDNFERMRLRLGESAEEKAQSEQQSRELISNISHDLKTPITSIKGYVEGIMDGIADSPEKMDKYIKTIYNKANDMDRLIDELTVYSQIDSNKIPYNFHKMAAADYFDDCAEEVGLDLEARGIEFHYENLVPEGTFMIADPEQLKRVINNIIHNSVKYSDKEKGVISIRISDEDETICVEIADNGKGIPAADLKRIFERFYRTDASRNSQQGGSGIGLSIAKRVVEEHGGEIWATGADKMGVTIHFTLRKFLPDVEVVEDNQEMSNGPIAKIEKIVKKTGKMLKEEATKSIENWNSDGRNSEGKKNKEKDK